MVMCVIQLSASTWIIIELALVFNIKFSYDAPPFLK